MAAELEVTESDQLPIQAVTKESLTEIMDS